MGFLISASTGKSLSLEDFPSVKERMQDMVRVLQNPTEERKEVLSCFTKCLSKDEELQDLERRVRGPRKNWGREREEPVRRQPAIMGVGLSPPSPGPRCLRSGAPGSYRWKAQQVLSCSLFNAAGIFFFFETMNFIFFIQRFLIGYLLYTY